MLFLPNSCRCSSPIFCRCLNCFCLFPLTVIMISYLPVDINRRYPQISTGRFVHYVSTGRIYFDV
nr:MAG TPA: hypothetical protein [Caudoviricetes sp.]